MPDAIQRLIKLVEHGNIANALDKEELLTIGTDVCFNYKLDRESRAQWEERCEEAVLFAKQIVEPKNFPWPGASNVVFPLLPVAANVFASRVYPELIKDNKVVKVATFGADGQDVKHQRAQRVSAHMSYQRLIESDTWEPDTDKLLHILPIVGVCFRKVYYNAVSGMPESDLCNPQDIVVHNSVPSIFKAHRITHRYFLSKNEMVEKIRSGYFVDVDLDDLESSDTSENVWQTSLDDKSGAAVDAKDQKQYEILEQHTFRDLDDDGYQEPYIIITLKKSNEVLGIYPRFDIDKDVLLNGKDEIYRINPTHYFVDYHFLPSPDGDFYSLGYGHLLYPLNKAINSILNQLIDSGTLANTQSGIVSRQLKIKGGQIKTQMGEFVQADAGTTGRIADAIYQFQFKDPSPVLLQLLGLVIDSARQIASINDLLTGAGETQNSPAFTTLEMANQGMKLFNSIYKRLHRSFKKEFKLLFDLNREYLDEQEYFNFFDNQMAIARQDYEEEGIDILPVGNPNMGSDVEKSAQANALQMLLQNPQVAQFLKVPQVVREFFEALKIPEEKINQFMFTDEELQMMQQNKQPDPDQIKMQIEMEKTKNDFQVKMLQEQRARAELEMKLMEIEKKYAIKEGETAEKQQRMLADAMFKRTQAEQLSRKLDIEEEKTEVMKEKAKSDKSKS